MWRTTPPAWTRHCPTSSATIYFDAQVTSERKKSILKAIAAGKHIYTEKPTAETVAEGIELVTPPATPA